MAIATPTSATYIYRGSFENSEGGFIGIGAKKYTYKVYRDDVGAYLMYHSKDACYPFQHYQNVGTIELAYTISVTLSSQTAFNFSKSLGLELGISKLAALAATASGGLEATTGISISATGTVGSTLPASSPTGFYKLTPCQDFHQRRLDKYEQGSTMLLSSEYCFIPENATYIAILYSTDNSSYGKYR